MLKITGKEKIFMGFFFYRQPLPGCGLGQERVLQSGTVGTGSAWGHYLGRGRSQGSNRVEKE